jgi:hypothetical protein
VRLALVVLLSTTCRFRVARTLPGRSPFPQADRDNRNALVARAWDTVKSGDGGAFPTSPGRPGGGNVIRDPGNSTLQNDFPNEGRFNFLNRR